MMQAKGPPLVKGREETRLLPEGLSSVAPDVLEPVRAFSCLPTYSMGLQAVKTHCNFFVQSTMTLYSVWWQPSLLLGEIGS